MKKILHIITDLEQGGAEGVLYRLVSSDSKNIHVVISLMSRGYYGDKIDALGVKLYTIDFKRGTFNIKGFIKLMNLIKSESPTIVQTWLYHADLLGSFAARIIGLKNIFWSLHLSNVSFKSVKTNTYIIIRLLSLLSYFIPKRIITCSRAGYISHTNCGYNKKIFNYIPLGFNYSTFYYSENLRDKFRKNYNLNNDTILVGCVARWDLQKDHNNLFNSISLLKSQSYFSNLKVCLAGYEMDMNNTNLLNLIKKYDLDIDMFLLIGAVNNINEVYNGLDILILSSRGEAFPNVIAEAILTNLPVISTDVGDVKMVFNDYIDIVPPLDSLMLSKKLNLILAKQFLKRERLSCTDVNRFKNEVIINYSIDNMIQLHYKTWNI